MVSEGSRGQHGLGLDLITGKLGSSPEGDHERSIAHYSKSVSPTESGWASNRNVAHDCLMAALSGLRCSNETPTATTAKTDAAPTPPDATEIVLPRCRLPALRSMARACAVQQQKRSARPIAFGTPRGDRCRCKCGHFWESPRPDRMRMRCGPLDFANWANGLGLFFRKTSLPAGTSTRAAMSPPQAGLARVAVARS